MEEATSESSSIGYVSVTLDQLVTPGSGGRLYAMHHAIRMGGQNIRVLQQTLTGIFNLTGTLEQKMHNMSQNGTDQFIKGSLTNSLRDDFEVRISTLTEGLDGVQKLTQGGGLNTVVGDFKSLTDVTVWVRANIPSDAPKFEHFIDLDILLSGIHQTGVSSEELRNKEVHTERVNISEKQPVVVTSFQRTSTQDWGSSKENNHFSKMTAFEHWNYGDGQRGILHIIKKVIIIYENAAHLSLYYAFAHHAQARLLCNDLLTETINYCQELATVVEDFYHRI